MDIKGKGNGEDEEKEKEKEEPKTTLGKVLSAVVKAPSKAKRFLVGIGKIKNDGKVADGHGAVIILDSPPLSVEELLALDTDNSVEVSSESYPLGRNFILSPAAPPAARDINNNNNLPTQPVDPETPLNAEPIARGLFRMGANRQTVQDAVGVALSPAQITVASFKAQSGQDEGMNSSFKFKISARRLSEENLSKFLADVDDDDQGSFDVVNTEEFEKLLDDVSPDFKQDETTEPEGKKKPEGTSEETSGAGHV